MIFNGNSELATETSEPVKTQDFVNGLRFGGFSSILYMTHNLFTFLSSIVVQYNPSSM